MKRRHQRKKYPFLLFMGILLGVTVSVWCLLPPAPALPATQSSVTEPAASSEERDRPLAQRGVCQMMNGKLDAAIATFQQIERQDPSSPLGYLLEADVNWWKIYYTTANLIDPDVFDVVYASSTPYDARFQALVNTSIQKAQTRIGSHRDVARSYLYEGMAYALEGRLAGLRAKDLAAARAGKKMRSLLLTALQMDPKLTDAYAGIGLYNYFADTLPAIVKMLRFVIGLPAGSRQKGLQQMYKAAQDGEYTAAEAKFYLAKDFTRRNEMQFGKSLELFQGLAQQFPGNPFWKLMVGSLEMRLKQRKQGEALYRQVLLETANKRSAADQAIHRQVVEALQRLHPQEKFH